MVGLGRDGVQQVSARDDGGPASATPIFEDGEIVGATTGMSLRDVFAGQALIGMGDWCPSEMGDGVYALTHAETQRRRAVWAYAQADAMLAARKQP